MDIVAPYPVVMPIGCCHQIPSQPEPMRHVVCGTEPETASRAYCEPPAPRPPKRRASSARPHPPPTPHDRSRPAPYPNMMCHSNDYEPPPLNYCTATNILLQYINFIEHV
jgi:hypothetical protein